MSLAKMRLLYFWRGDGITAHVRFLNFLFGERIYKQMMEADSDIQTSTVVTSKAHGISFIFSDKNQFPVHRHGDDQKLMFVWKKKAHIRRNICRVKRTKLRQGSACTVTASLFTFGWKHWDDLWNNSKWYKIETFVKINLFYKMDESNEAFD